MPMLEIGPATLNQMSLAKQNSELVKRLDTKETRDNSFDDWHRINVKFGETHFNDLEPLKRFYQEQKGSGVLEGGTDAYIDWIKSDALESAYCDFFLKYLSPKDSIPMRLVQRFARQQDLLKSPAEYLLQLTHELGGSSEGWMLRTEYGDNEFIKKGDEIEIRCTDTLKKITWDEKGNEQPFEVATVSAEIRITSTGEVRYQEMEISFHDPKFKRFFYEKLEEQPSESSEVSDISLLREATYNIVDNYLDVFAHMNLPPEVKKKIAAFKSKYSDPDKYNFILHAYSVLKEEQAERETNGRFDAALRVVTDLAEYLDCKIQPVDDQSLIRSMHIDGDLGSYDLLIKRTKPVYRFVYQEGKATKSIELRKPLYDTLSEMAKELNDETRKKVFNTELSVHEFIEQVIKADRTSFLDEPVIVEYCRSKGFTLFQDQSGNVRLYPNTFSEKTPKGYIYSQDENGVHTDEVTEKAFRADAEKKEELWKELHRLPITRKFGGMTVRPGFDSELKTRFEYLGNSVKSIDVPYSDFVYSLYSALAKYQLENNLSFAFDKRNAAVFKVLVRDEPTLRVFNALLFKLQISGIKNAVAPVLSMFSQMHKGHAPGDFMLNLFSLLIEKTDMEDSIVRSVEEGMNEIVHDPRNKKFFDESVNKKIREQMKKRGITRHAKH